MKKINSFPVEKKHLEFFIILFVVLFFVIFAGLNKQPVVENNAASFLDIRNEKKSDDGTEKFSSPVISNLEKNNILQIQEENIVNHEITGPKSKIVQIFPVEDYTINAPYLFANRQIVFTWAYAGENNGYLFSLRQGDETFYRYVDGPYYVFDNLTLLRNGSADWTVEPIRYKEGEIIRSGNISKSTFKVKIPEPDAPIAVFEGDE